MVANASSCHLSSFFIGIAEICFMSAPVGPCDYCCPRDDTVDIQYKLYTRPNSSTFEILPPGDIDGLRATSFNFSAPTVIYVMGFSESVDGVGTTTVRNEHVFADVFITAILRSTKFRRFYRYGTLRSLSEQAYYELLATRDVYLPVNYQVLLKGELRTRTRTTAFLAANNYNFIAVDWSRLIVWPWYISALRNTRYMGENLAVFVNFLDSAGVPASKVHVVGFSLGAEAAGFAGKGLKARGLLLGRITGLDPAYPGYSFANNDGHLARGDAAFVDVLHTNPGLLGFPQALGDVDFYANPGSWIQPGCWVDQLIKNREFRYIYGCSHVRAWRLFSESLSNPMGFPATLCKDWTSSTRQCSFQVNGYMGINARPPMVGKMYFMTNPKPPFAKNGP